MAKKTIRYVVRGRGLFPEDMLRYDDSWYATQEDQEAGESERRDWRNIGLYTTQREPTRARWESFNWSVIKVEY